MIPRLEKGYTIHRRFKRKKNSAIDKSSSNYSDPKYSIEKSKFEYRIFLLSDKWKKIREKVLLRDNYKCVYCGIQAINVHHLRYSKNWKNEKLSNLVSVCKSCHKKLHNIPVVGEGNAKPGQQRRNKSNCATVRPS